MAEVVTTAAQQEAEALEAAGCEVDTDVQRSSEISWSLSGSLKTSFNIISKQESWLEKKKLPIAFDKWHHLVQGYDTVSPNTQFQSAALFSRVPRNLTWTKLAPFGKILEF